MSRRSRRRGSSRGSWLGKVMLGAILLVMLAVGVLFWSVRAYLHSEAFRDLLAAQVGRAARVNGHFSPFRWQGLAVDCDRFEGTGDGPVTGLKVEGLHTEVGVGGIRRGVWELGGSNIRRVDLALDLRQLEEPDLQAAARQAGHMAGSPQSARQGWLPTRVALQETEVQEIVLRARTHSHPLLLSGLHLKLQPDDTAQNFKVETRGGQLKSPIHWLPQLELERTRMRWQDGSLFLQSASARISNDARIEASGEWNASTGRFAFEGGLSDLPCATLFNETWARRFTGRLSSTFNLENPGGTEAARGSLVVRDGILTALPVLDALAAYADTRRFRVLNLNEARTDWRWEDGTLQLSRLTLASDGLIRLEGTLGIRDRQLDGNFRLGLPPGTLASIPGAETHVFQAGERGMLWTPLRVTGTLDDPKEDLTERLIAAAGMRMFDVIPESGEKVIRFSRSLLGESAPQAVESGARIIEEGAGIVRDVGGVLDSILGTGQPSQEPPPPEN